MTVTYSIYHFEINPTNAGDFRLKLPEDTHSGVSLRKSFHYIRWAKISFLRATLNKTIYWKVLKKSVFGVLIKISISVMSFCTESAKRFAIYDLLLLTASYSPKNDNDHIPPTWEISTKAVTLPYPKFFPIWDPFWRQASKINLQSNFSKYIFA